MVELIICKFGNVGWCDMNIMLMCCELSVECNFFVFDLEGCFILVLFIDFNDVFINVEVCGGIFIMDYIDNGDFVICGDGDGVDFICIYMFY